ncbi:hypothetical protein [Desulfocurvus sp. DL9XJH121]
MPGPFLPALPPRRAVSVIIDTNQFDLGLLAWLTANTPWSGEGPATILVTIAPGVVVGATSTSSPALTWSGAPAGTQLTLVVSANAVVAGRGADSAGTYGGLNAPMPGYPGGPALFVDSPLSVDNRGIIGGGGGGGATGTDYVGNACSGAGGAGAGCVAGQGVWTGIETTPNAALLSGARGAYASSAGGYTAGGVGGDLGQDGEAADGQPGGSAGKAIIGMDNVTWITTGDLRGPTE